LNGRGLPNSRNRPDRGDADGEFRGDAQINVEYF
jgi:hypothetical protein